MEINQLMIQNLKELNIILNPINILLASTLIKTLKRTLLKIEQDLIHLASTLIINSKIKNKHIKA
jgi:hypothetical protein